MQPLTKEQLERIGNLYHNMVRSKSAYDAQIRDAQRRSIIHNRQCYNRFPNSVNNSPEFNTIIELAEINRLGRLAHSRLAEWHKQIFDNDIRPYQDMKDRDIWH
jgi:hypothetical protein